MQNDRERAHRLARERRGVHGCERAECLEPGRHIAQTARVEGSGAAIVSGVQSCQQLPHLLASALTDHETVGAHAQRLADQSCEADAAGALEVRLSRLESDMVGVLRAQLGHILDRDDALGGRRGRQQRRQQSRLACAGAAGDEDVGALSHQTEEPAVLPGVEGTERRQRIEIRGAHSGHTDR